MLFGAKWNDIAELGDKTVNADNSFFFNDRICGYRTRILLTGALEQWSIRTLIELHDGQLFRPELPRISGQATQVLGTIGKS